MKYKFYCNFKNLDQLLDNEIGKRFGTVSKNRPFSTTEQLLLSEKICMFLFENQILTKINSHEIFTQIVHQIVQKFPFEKNNAAAYYHKESNAKNMVGGVLYNKYSTITKRFNRVLQTSKDEIRAEEPSTSNDFQQNEQQINALKWLDENRCPTSEFYDKLEYCWEITSYARKPDSNLIDSWSQYKLTIGYKLIDIDFNFHFSKNKMFSVNSFRHFVKFDWDILKMEIKSPIFKKQMDNHLFFENEGKILINL